MWRSRGSSERSHAGDLPEQISPSACFSHTDSVFFTETLESGRGIGQGSLVTNRIHTDAIPGTFIDLVWIEGERYGLPSAERVTAEVEGRFVRFENMTEDLIDTICTYLDSLGFTNVYFFGA